MRREHGVYIRLEDFRRLHEEHKLHEQVPNTIHNLRINYIDKLRIFEQWLVDNTEYSYELFAEEVWFFAEKDAIHTKLVWG